MIQILQFLQNILGKLKINIKYILIILLLLFGNKCQYSMLQEKNTEISRLIKNTKAYESMANSNENNNRVLNLTIEDLRNSNDSLIKTITSYQNKLDIKNKELEQAIGVSTVIRDTLIQVIPSKEINFDIEIKPNALTTFKISRTDSVLTCIPEIYNDQHLFIYSRKEYRNKRKNFFDRLIHFDFKKDKTQRYEIINTNDLIKVVNTRVINISK